MNNIKKIIILIIVFGIILVLVIFGYKLAYRKEIKGKEKTDYIIKVKGLNTEEVTNKDEINVDGTIKDTNIEIVKTLEKNNPKDTEKNTYTVDIRNKGEYVARGVTVEEKIDKNGEILKDTVKVLNSKGEDVTKKMTDLKIEKDMITFTIDNIGKNENYKLVYDVKYNETEKTAEMVSVTKVKAKNSKEEIIVTKNKIDATVKETKLEIEI